MNPKYRVWSKTEKKMLKHIQEINFEYSGELVGVETESLDYHGANEIELMQSTGLKDKRGQEIFVGDIVKMYSGELLPVVLNHGMFEPVCFYLSKVFEKVGNIFENPELLEYPDFRGHKCEEE